jgi:methylenetetrahydrofolate dehydrogenase (NADP+)/methenyltetrahydrofolate cyclohydrolase
LGLIDLVIILDGKKLSERLLEEVAAEVRKRNLKPSLAAVLVGEDPASKLYIKNKRLACKKVGIKPLVYELPASTSEVELLKLINQLNYDNGIDAILVQLPLPKQINENKVLESINPKKDVDGFHPVNLGKLLIGDETFPPATPAGIITLLENYKIQVEGKNAVVIGRSNIVGKPLSLMLLNRNSTVTVCHSKTRNIKEYCKMADLLIVAVGKPKFVTEDFVKKGAVVIDVGTNFINGKIVGDVDFEGVISKAKAITPTPGGVGLMTVAMLMKNTLSLCINKLVR